MRRILLVSVSVAGLIIGLSPLPSQAGFEWTPPTSMPRSTGAVQTIEPQQPQLSNAGPLTPEPVLRAPVPSIEPVSSDMLDDDMPPPPPSRNVRMGQSELMGALPSAVDAPQILAPNNLAPEPQVFVPTMTQNSRVDGFGRRIPLSIALKQIVPNNYVYKFDAGVTPKTKVSWQGGDSWVNVLNEMLDSSNLSGRLDGNVIRISKGAGDIVMLPQSSSSGRTAMLMPTSQESLMGQGVGQNASRDIVDLQTRRNWSAASGATLRDALSSWAREAGVQLEWQSNVNYPVNSTFNFEGTFDQAVDSLLSLYADEGSAPKGKLYPNRPNGPSVLVVDSL